MSVPKRSDNIPLDPPSKLSDPQFWNRHIERGHRITIECNKKGKPITGPEIVEELDHRRSDDIGSITLNNLSGRIVPELKRKRGLENAPRIGYYYSAYYGPTEGDNPTEA